MTYTAQERGHMYVANASDQEVFFDQMVVEHIPQLIVQENHYYPFGLELSGIMKKGKPEHRWKFNGKEKQGEFGLNWLDYGWRNYDAVLGRWFGVDELSEKYYTISPYAYVANMPIRAIDPDGKRIYFVGGAGDDRIGWNYTQRFRRIWTGLGISGFKRLRVSSSSSFMSKNVAPTNDMLYTMNNRSRRASRLNERRSFYRNMGENSLTVPAEYRARMKIVKDIKANPLKKGEQLNLSGYSYGSVVMAQAALQLVDDGYKVDNLILIGSPISTKSKLYKALLEYQKQGKIGKIIRHDIKGDKLSNPSSISEFMQGAKQNTSEKGPHFDLARPDDPKTKNINEEAIANKKIKELGQFLRKLGVK